jgi:hypothetical protein
MTGVGFELGLGGRRLELSLVEGWMRAGRAGGEERWMRRPKMISTLSGRPMSRLSPMSAS